MGKGKRRRPERKREPLRRKQVTDERVWITDVVLNDIPVGPQGQPAHRAGSEIRLIQVAPVMGWDDCHSSRQGPRCSIGDR